MKKINFTSSLLLIYLIVMSVIGWPGNRPGNSYTEYFCIMGASLFVIILLRFVQIKRYKMRQNR
ncbi:MAG: hypothetical protein RR382_03365 [Tannerellaceae bacterium]